MTGRENDSQSRLTPGDGDFYTDSMSAGETGEQSSGQPPQEPRPRKVVAVGNRVNPTTGQVEQVKYTPRRFDQAEAVRNDPVLLDAAVTRGIHPSNVMDVISRGAMDINEGIPQNVTQEPTAQEAQETRPTRTRQERQGRNNDAERGRIPFERRVTGEVRVKDWDLVHQIDVATHTVEQSDDPGRVEWQARFLQRWVETILRSAPDTDDANLKLKKETKDALRKYVAITSGDSPSIDDLKIAVKELEAVDINRFFEKVPQYQEVNPQSIDQLMFLLTKNARGVNNDDFFPGGKYALVTPEGKGHKQNWTLFMRSQENTLNNDSPWAPSDIMAFVGYRNGRGFVGMNDIYDTPAYFLERTVNFQGDEENGTVQGEEVFISNNDTAEFKRFHNNLLFGANKGANTLQNRNRNIMWKGGSTADSYKDNLMTDGPVARWSWMLNESSYDDPSDHRIGVGFKHGVNAHKYIFELLHPEAGFRMLKDDKGQEVTMLRKVLGVEGFNAMCESFLGRALASNTDYKAEYMKILQAGLRTFMGQAEPNLAEALQEQVDALDLAVTNEQVSQVDLFGNVFFKNAMMNAYNLTEAQFAHPQVQQWYRAQYNTYVGERVRTTLRNRIGAQQGDAFKKALTTLDSLGEIVYGGKSSLADLKYKTTVAEIAEAKGISPTDTDLVWSYILEEFTRGMTGAVGKEPQDFLPFNSTSRDFASMNMTHLSVMDGVFAADIAEARGSGGQPLNAIDKQYISNNVWNALPTLGYRETGDPDAIMGETYLRRKRYRNTEGRGGGGDLNNANGNIRALPYDVVVQLVDTGTNKSVSLSEALGTYGFHYDPRRYLGTYKCATGIEGGFGIMHENTTKLVNKLSTNAFPDVTKMVHIARGHVGPGDDASKMQGEAGAEKSRLDTYTGDAQKAGSFDMPYYYMGWEFNPASHKMELGFRYGTPMDACFSTEYLALKKSLDQVKYADDIQKGKLTIEDKPRNLPLSVAHIAYLIHKQVYAHYFDHRSSPWGMAEDKPVDTKIQGRKEESDYTPQQRAYHGILQLTIDPEPVLKDGVIEYHYGPLFIPQLAEILVNPFSLRKAIGIYSGSRSRGDFKL